MKFIHLSDLHIGKKLNNISLIDDQRHILRQITDIIRKRCLDAVVIAGDVYDKSMPSAEAVELFDDFLTDLSALEIPIMIISGNHDSPERLRFGGRIMKNIHICTEYGGKLECVSVQNTDFYLLPFVRPQNLRTIFNQEDLRDYNEMAELIFTDFTKKTNRKSVLVMHQFITNGSNVPDMGGSEAVTVGTLDNINASHLKDFDYVALGHIHRQQSVETDKIIYCGSPLKYSFAEATQEKSVIIVDTENEMQIETVNLHPLHDMRKIKGGLEELLKPEIYAETDTEDYLQITLTDKEPVTGAAEKLGTVYKNVLEIIFERNKNYIGEDPVTAAKIQNQSPLELFCGFYEEQNGTEMNENQIELVRQAFEEAEENI